MKQIFARPDGQWTRGKQEEGHQKDVGPRGLEALRDLIQ
jgi:hypothetical protein